MTSVELADKLLRDTNDDATISKLSCVDFGYIEDDFVHNFVSRAARRPPIINRGYFARMAALRGILNYFLRATAHGGNHNDTNREAWQHKTRQVLVLGAGFDTCWLHRKSRGEDLPDRWVEVDFQEVTRSKLGVMQRHNDISKLIDPMAVLDADGCSLTSAAYSLLPLDLRNPDQLVAALRTIGLDFEAPTLVVAECVLVYMSPSESSALVSTLGALLPNAVFAVYEQIRPYDAFGRQMLHNLRERGCPLRGITATPDLEAQKSRFTKGGWSRAIARDMATIYHNHIDPLERNRAERKQLFDEVEEWNLMQEHYCIAIGINDQDGLFSSFDFETFDGAAST